MLNGKHIEKHSGTFWKSRYNKKACFVNEETLLYVEKWAKSCVI